LSGLPAKKAAAAQEFLSRRQARASIEKYIAYCELGFLPVAHHRLILHELEAVERGDTSRLMICMPPGSAKSTYTSATFPAWYLGRHPESFVIATSHTDELANDFGRKVRNLFASPAHRNVFGIGVSPDNKSAGRWETERGGEYFAAGVGGSITGRRADLGIVDDPVKSREDADSELSRKRKWDWYINDFYPRLKPEGRQIIVTTRWHEDDIAGRLLERERGKWRVVELAMEALPDDPLGRKPGERLWPEWFTEEQVETAKRDVRAWNALYQQRPASEEGDYFKLDWFSTYDKLPAEAIKYGASDYAVTEGSGDYTEHGIFAVDAQSNIYICDWWREQASADRWVESQCDLIRKHSPVCWFGEAGPIRRAVEPYLLKRMGERRAFARLEWLTSMSEKTARCRPFQALASMGRIFLPENAGWKAELLGQLTRFPAAKYDDGVDVCSLIGRGIEMMPAPRIRQYEPPPERAPLRDLGGNAWLSV
jgi:predicted phage terminase large subunit-like protein